MVKRLHLPYALKVTLLYSVENRVVQGTAPSHASIPPNQNGTMALARLMRRKNVLGKIQPSERYYEVTFVRHDDHSGVLIGAGEERRSDWPARVLPNHDNRSITRVRRAIDCTRAEESHSSHLAAATHTGNDGLNLAFEQLKLGLS